VVGPRRWRRHLDPLETDFCSSRAARRPLRPADDSGSPAAQRGRSGISPVSRTPPSPGSSRRPARWRPSPGTSTTTSSPATIPQAPRTRPRAHAWWGCRHRCRRSRAWACPSVHCGACLYPARNMSDDGTGESPTDACSSGAGAGARSCDPVRRAERARTRHGPSPSSAGVQVMVSCPSARSTVRFEPSLTSPRSRARPMRVSSSRCRNRRSGRAP
jgi:hypothetical protein